MIRLATVLCLGVVLTAQAAGPQFSQERNFVLGYLDARSAGNVKGIRRRMGTEEKSQHDRLLKNPTYGSHLRNLHGGAQAVVNGASSLGNDNVAVSVSSTLSNGQVVDRVYIVGPEQNGALKIRGETDLSSFCDERPASFCRR